MLLPWLNVRLLRVVPQVAAGIVKEDYSFVLKQGAREYITGAESAGLVVVIRKKGVLHTLKPADQPADQPASHFPPLVLLT